MDIKGGADKITGHDAKGGASFFFLSAMAFFAFYAFINAALLHQGIIHPNLMFFAEKALLVLKGHPARLENFGFIYPPLPILITSLLNGNVLLAQSIVAALISAALALDIRKAVPVKGWAFPLIIYTAFCFPILFLATQGFDIYLYLFIVVLSVRFLYRHEKNEASLDLFMAGILFGVTFFIHFSSIYLIPMFLILICMLYRNQPQKIMPVSLAFFTPFLVSLLIFSYVNLIFTGEAFGFLKKHKLLFSNSDIEAVLSSGSFMSSLFYMLKYVVWVVPVIVPYLLGFRYHKSVILVLPFMVLLSLIYANLFSPAIFLCSVFIIHFLLMNDFWGSLKQKTLLTALGISLVAAPVMALISTEANEKKVAQAVFGVDQASSLAPFQKIAALLQDKKGKILLDDTRGYPLVYLMQDPERFILPYQYEFAVALSNPARLANYAIAWKDKGNDLVFQQFEGHMEQFRPLFEDETVIIWEKTK
jgi:hypothetical protein